MTLDVDTSSAEEFAERVFAAALGAVVTWAMYMGDKLDLYRLLAEHGLSRAMIWRLAAAWTADTPTNGWSSR